MKKLLLIFTFLNLIALSFSACSLFSSPAPTTPTYPPASTAHPAMMPPLTLGTHQNLIYFINTFTNPNSSIGTIKRFDTTSQTSVDVGKLPNADIEEAQVSPDGQWILFVAWMTDHDELRLVSVDGQDLQILLASEPYGAIVNVQWSPDQKFVAFDQQPPQYGPVITELLDIKSGHLQSELIPPQANLYYAPRKWLDNTHLALASVIPNSYDSLQNFSILDTARGANQHSSDLLQVSSGAQNCADFDSSNNGSQVFISTCAVNPASQKGPSAITVQPASGGPAKTIFTSQSLVIRQIRFVNPQTLLLIADSGAWTVHTDGTGLTLLKMAPDQHNRQVFCEFTQTPWSNVSRDGTLYALESSELGVDTHTESLDYGSLTGGALHTITSAFGIASGHLYPRTSDALLVGWTRL